MMLTNTGDSDLAITNMEGYYCTTGRRGSLVGMAIYCVQFISIGDGLGEWAKCDDGWIGVESYRDYHFYDTPNFNIKSAQIYTLAIRLCIKITGDVLTFLCITMYTYVFA